MCNSKYTVYNRLNAKSFIHKKLILRKGHFINNTSSNLVYIVALFAKSVLNKDKAEPFCVREQRLLVVQDPECLIKMLHYFVLAN